MTHDYTNPSDDRLRAGDADRERVADQLSRAHAEGRIDDDELADRLGRCYAARTFAELDPLTVDVRVLERREPQRLAGRRLPRSPVRLILVALLALWVVGAIAHAAMHAFALVAVLVVAFAVVQLVRAVRA